MHFIQDPRYLLYLIQDNGLTKLGFIHRKKAFAKKSRTFGKINEEVRVEEVKHDAFGKSRLEVG